MKVFLTVFALSSLAPALSWGDSSPCEGKQAAVLPVREAACDSAARKEESCREKDTAEKLRDAELKVAEKELNLDQLRHKSGFAAREYDLNERKASQRLTDAAQARDEFRKRGLARAGDELAHKCKRAKDAIEYKKDELKQLRQMYTEDQLTDASEEIVLKRTVREVEDAEFALSGMNMVADVELNVKLPRKQKQLQDDVDAAGLALEKLKDERALEVRREKLAEARAVYELKQACSERDACRNNAAKSTGKGA